METRKKKAYVTPTVKCFKIELTAVIASSISTNVEDWEQNTDDSGSDSWTNK